MGKKKLLFKICAPFVNEERIKERPTIQNKEEEEKKSENDKVHMRIRRSSKVDFYFKHIKLNTYELHNLWCLHCKKLKRDRFQFRYKERPIDHGAEMRGNIS